MDFLCHRDQNLYVLCRNFHYQAYFCRKVLYAKILKCFCFRKRNEAFVGPEIKLSTDQIPLHPLERGLGSLSPAPISQARAKHMLENKWDLDLLSLL